MISPESQRESACQLRFLTDKTSLSGSCRYCRGCIRQSGNELKQLSLNLWPRFPCISRNSLCMRKWKGCCRAPSLLLFDKRYESEPRPPSCWGSLRIALQYDAEVLRVITAIITFSLSLFECNWEVYKNRGYHDFI